MIMSVRSRPEFDIEERTGQQSRGYLLTFIQNSESKQVNKSYVSFVLIKTICD